MISNEAVRRLIETDREALVELMVVASYDGSGTGSGSMDIWNDQDIRQLLEDVRELRRRPWATRGSDGVALWRWKEQMSKV